MSKLIHQSPPMIAWVTASSLDTSDKKKVDMASFEKFVAKRCNILYNMYAKTVHIYIYRYKYKTDILTQNSAKIAK